MQMFLLAAMFSVVVWCKTCDESNIRHKYSLDCINNYERDLTREEHYRGKCINLLGLLFDEYQNASVQTEIRFQHRLKIEKINFSLDLVYLLLCAIIYVPVCLKKTV